MIIYRLCKVLSFTWSMTLSSTIWFWILKTFSQNPDAESQHRYESKYFHEKDLNNSYFVLFLWNKILYFHSHVKKNQILIWCSVLALNSPSVCGDLPMWSTVMRTTVLYYFICNAIYIQNVIHNICCNVKNILYSNFMIIYRLCRVQSCIKEGKTKRRTMIYKILHRKLKIKQHEANKTRMNSCAPEW
jgi:hypothetical protein